MIRNDIYSVGILKVGVRPTLQLMNDDVGNVQMVGRTVTTKLD